MFGFLKRGKKTADDTLSDIKTVSRWMQDLPTGDIYTAQEQVVQSLIQFNHAQMPMSKERLNVLMHLDEHARDMQFSLCSQYLRNPRMSKVIESRLWTAIHAFYWEITRGYHAFLMDFVSDPGGSRIQHAVPQITARALRGFANIFKWRYFRYEKIEDKLWIRLHNIYRIAEFDSFAGSALKVYPSDAQISSCAREYVQALLLSPLGSGSLTPRQIDMVDQWLDNWGDMLSLDRQADADRHAFYVDLAKGAGLRRLRKDMSGDNTWRYVPMDKLLDHLELVRRSLKSGATPASVGLGEEFRLPDGYDLLEYVSNEWSPLTEQDRRRATRHPIQSRWEVVRDLSNITQRMQADINLASGQGGTTLSPEEILDIKLYGFVTERTKAIVRQKTIDNLRPEGLERWPLQDRSETGIGVVLRNDDGDWVRVSKLLSLRPDPGEHWRLGVIRRISRIDADWRKIGIEFLSEQPRLVHVELMDTAPLAYAVDDSVHLGDESQASPAILIPDKDTELLVLESAKYAHGRTLKLHDGDEMRFIKLESVKDKGDGWLMTQYSTVE
ncbi:MAG TPA: hypothetical protein PLW81_09840 [Thiobacillaceae bacterium]|nr:hypothetical protein [Thiobacillaceae bacterium]